MLSRIPRHVAIPPILTGLIFGLFVSVAGPVHADPLPVYTSPIDVTKLHLTIDGIAPDLDTGKPIPIFLPVNSMPGGNLGPLFDGFWSSKRQQMCDNIQQLAASTVQKKLGKDYGIYDYSCNLASTGSVLYTSNAGWSNQPKLGPSVLGLAYTLSGSSIEFYIRTPFGTCSRHTAAPLCPNDPGLKVDFTPQIVTSIRGPQGVCSMSADGGDVVMQGTPKLESRGAWSLVKIWDDVFNDGDVQQMIKDAFTKPTKIALPLDAALQALIAPCKQPDTPKGRTLAGFSSAMDTVIEPNIGLIHMRFTHPPLVPPKTFGAPVPRFAGPAITAPPIAAAGSTITVSGQFFPTQRVEPTVLSVALQHDSACPGGRTDLKWGPQGGPTRWDHLPIDSCNTDDPLSNLTPGTTYQFQARDCDDSTCSQWTAPFNLTTASASDAGMGGDIPLTLDGAPLGTTKAGADGRFDKDVVIPAGTAPGNHKLRATSGHLTPETGVQVTAATGGNTTMILTGTFYGDRGCPMRPLTDKAIQMESPFSVFGAGFTPGTMTLHLDSATGIGLGSATVGADGTFCNDAFQGPPSSQLGDHTLVAVQDANVRFTLPIKVVRPSHVN